MADDPQVAAPKSFDDRWNTTPAAQPAAPSNFDQRWEASGQQSAPPVLPPSTPVPTPAKSDERSLWKRVTDHFTAENIGQYVPQSSIPALEAAKKYGVDPFNKMAASGAEFGRNLGTEAVTGYDTLTHPDRMQAYMPSPYGPKPAMESMETTAERDHPMAMGAARGIGGVAGGTVADPRNWPLFASSAARPILQRLISGGFGTQMAAGAIDGAKNLYQNWDKLTPSQRSEIGTQTGLTALMASGAALHALNGGEISAESEQNEALNKISAARQKNVPAKSNYTPGKPSGERLQHVTIPIEPHSPVGENLSEPAPLVRVADSDAARDELLHQDTNRAPVDPASSDRRVDIARRRNVADMTPEEMKKELLTSEKTGLPNRRAFEESEDKGAVAMSDADGLKALNDKYGYAAGDQLLKAKADALKQAGVEAYHDKGDEFLARGKTPEELHEKLEQAREILRNHTIDVTLEDGSKVQFKGADFSHGSGRDLAEAESNLKTHKAEREAAGERARGELRGISEVRPQENQGNQGATAKVTPEEHSALIKELFGDQASRYESLQKTADSDNPAFAKAASDLIDEMENKLTKPEQNRLWKSADSLKEPREPEAVEGRPAQTPEVEPDAEASVRAPEDVAAFRRPSARVVTDDHIPVISRNQILAEALQNIANNSKELKASGLDLGSVESHEDIDAILQKGTDFLRSNLDPRAAATITLETQKQLAAKDLNMSLDELLSRKSGQAFNAEEAIKARALLHESSIKAVDLAKKAAASGDKTMLDQAMWAIARHQAIQEHIAGIRAEAGRALGSYRVGEDTLPGVKLAGKISDAITKLPDNKKAEAIKWLAKIDPNNTRQVNNFIAEITPSTPIDKFYEFYRNALLSSPHIITIKTASEASIAAMEMMKKAVAGGLELGATKLKLKPSPDRFAAEAWYYAQGMAQALREHGPDVLSGKLGLHEDLVPKHAIKGTLGKIVRTPSEAMSRMTDMVYIANYFGELNSLAAREALKHGLSGDQFHAEQEQLAHSPTKEMIQAAHELALHNTFQNELVGSLKDFDAGVRKSWILKFAFPFRRSPINLVKASLTHTTPYELVKEGVGGKYDVDATARGLVGASILSLAAYLAMNGTITGGGPLDYKKEETLRAKGWQDYSVKIGDRYVHYKRFQPVGLTFGLVADAIHGMMKGDPENVADSKINAAYQHVLRNVDDLPFFTTLSNLLQATEDKTGNRVDSFIARQAGSFIPAIVANTAETIDPTVRHAGKPGAELGSGGRLMSTIGQTLESRIPGMTGNVPPVIDITGHPVMRSPSDLGGANPFTVRSEKHDPTVDELARLGISTPQAPAKIKVAGRDQQLTDAERQAFAEEEGQLFYARITKLMQSPTWARMSDDQRRRLIIEVHKWVDEARPSRLTRMRKQATSNLAGGSL